MSDEQKNSEQSNSATATAEPKQQPKKAPRRVPPKPLPPWKVLLHNDDVNEMLYVVETIVGLTPLDPAQAAQRTLEAHKSGVALLLTTHQERAELYQEQFQSKRLTVTIEPAD